MAATTVPTETPIFLKTKPEILVFKSDNIEERFILEPSKCNLTLNERFLAIESVKKKKDIDPVLTQLQCPNTLIGRLQRNKAARLAAAPYTTQSPSVIRAGGKVKVENLEKPEYIDNLDFLEPEHTPGDPLSDLFAKFMKRNYCTGPTKSREELDDEIEQYFISVGGRGRRVFPRKTREMLLELYNRRNDPDFELNERINSININSESIEIKEEEEEEEEEPNLFGKFVQHMRSSGLLKQQKASLDQDLDDYFGSRRERRTLSQSLDDDLEDYRKQDPRYQSETDDNQEDDSME